MANKSKIVGKLENLVRDLCSKGYNARYISKQAGVAKDTIKSWASKNGFELSKGKGTRILDLEPKVIGMLKSGHSRKEIQKELDIHYTQVTEIAERNGLSDKLRTRQDASQDKLLSTEEIAKRTADNSKFLGYNKEKRQYAFQCDQTKKIFFKNITHMAEISSPYNKSGKPLTEEEYTDRLSHIGHTIEPGTFIKLKAPVIVYCKRGHKRELQKASWAFKFNCSVCGNNGTSRPEQELIEWIKGYYPSAYRFKFPERVTKPKEIDIYIPEIKLGIEYCGLYYHYENEILEQDADKNKHYKKMLRANELGIKLITVFESEWKNKKEQIKSFLISSMGKNTTKIGARKCEIKQIDKNTCDEFMDRYHIQGNDRSLISFGLYFQDELVGAMSCGEHPQRPGSEVGTVYLNRLAFKSGVTVMGGASKLLSKVVEWSKSHGYSRVVSWSDNRWTDGNVYRSLGFIFESQRDKGRGLRDGSIWPDFAYAINGKLYSRSKIKQMGLNEEDLNKVYDCGKKKWCLYL